MYVAELATILIKAMCSYSNCIERDLKHYPTKSEDNGAVQDVWGFWGTMAKPAHVAALWSML